MFGVRRYPHATYLRFTPARHDSFLLEEAIGTRRSFREGRASPRQDRDSEPPDERASQQSLWYHDARFRGQED
jgi:hypothetical protein